MRRMVHQVRARAYMSLRLGQIDVHWRLAVDLADDLAVARAEGAVELVGLRVRIKLFDADLVLAGRHLGNPEASVLLAPANARGELFGRAHVGLEHDLHTAVGTYGERLAAAKHAAGHGDKARPTIATTADKHDHQDAGQNSPPATAAQHG